MGLSQMIEYVIIIIAVFSAIIALSQEDLLKAAILTGISGACIDVALTQAIVGAAITPIFIALAIQKTKRTDD